MKKELYSILPSGETYISLSGDSGVYSSGYTEGYNDGTADGYNAGNRNGHAEMAVVAAGVGATALVGGLIFAKKIKKLKKEQEKSDNEYNALVGKYNNLQEKKKTLEENNLKLKTQVANQAGDIESLKKANAEIQKKLSDLITQLQLQE